MGGRGGLGLSFLRGSAGGTERCGGAVGRGLVGGGVLSGGPEGTGDSTGSFKAGGSEPRAPRARHPQRHRQEASTACISEKQTSDPTPLGVAQKPGAHAPSGPREPGFPR